MTLFLASFVSARRIKHLEMTQQPIACRAISLGPCSPHFGFQYCQAGFERLQQDSVIGSVQILLVHLGTAAIRTCNCFVNTAFLSIGVGNKTAHSLGTVVLLLDVCTFLVFHWSYHSWRPVPTSFHWMSSVPSRSNDTKSGS